MKNALIANNLIAQISTGAIAGPGTTVIDPTESKRFSSLQAGAVAVYFIIDIKSVTSASARP